MNQDTLNGRSPEYWEGVEEGRKHVRSSPETLDALEKLNRATVGMPEKLDDLIRNFNEEMKEARKFRENINVKAVMWTYSANAVKVMAGIALLAIITALVGNVVK